ncbi:hypothetical protein DO71_6013 [Burkholderia pseudomallei]|nr:hypothetical protein DO71_6013 [Burkholderia pseudomallei]
MSRSSRSSTRSNGSRKSSNRGSAILGLLVKESSQVGSYSHSIDAGLCGRL